jgi:hypothetical protein
VPFDLTEHQRQHLQTRLMAQAPTGLPPAELARTRRYFDKAIRGLPGDVVMSLDALALLAEQGNNVAKRLLEDECKRMGIDVGIHRSFAR